MKRCLNSYPIRLELKTKVFDVFFAANRQFTDFRDGVFFAQSTFFNARCVLRDLDFTVTATFNLLGSFITGHGNTSKKIECIDEMKFSSKFNHYFNWNIFFVNGGTATFRRKKSNISTSEINHLTHSTHPLALRCLFPQIKSPQK